MAYPPEDVTHALDQATDHMAQLVCIYRVAVKMESLNDLVYATPTMTLLTETIHTLINLKFLIETERQTETPR